MQAPVPVAARAAARRAHECHARVIELAQRQQFTAADVSRAESALATARQRAATAERRLSKIRSRRDAWPETAPAPAAHPTTNGRLAPDEIRRRSAGVEFSTLFASYLGLGGACTAFELEAFVNAALELADEELAILGHAVWEVSELGPHLGLQPGRTEVFAAEPAAARAARRWLAKRLTELGVCAPASRLHDDAILVLTELIANAVKAQATTVGVSVVASPTLLRIEVTDDAPGWPTLRRTAPEAASGRGVALVMALVTEWQVVPTADGKTVSVALDIPPG